MLYTGVAIQMGKSQSVMCAEAGNIPWDGGAIYARAEGVILRSIAGESLLVPIRKDLADLREIFTLNTIGVRIWNLLDGVLPLDGVLAAILDRYEVPEPVARVDLATFIEQLRQARLIESRA